MKILNMMIKAYARLHRYPGVPKRLLTPARLLMRHIASKTLPRLLTKKYTPSTVMEKNLIVSFTSFPTRIHQVWQVVECMKRQAVLPEKIILWLSKDQFPDENCIPLSLRSRQDGVFEIRMVDGDIRSHKKYYYVAKEYPNSLIFLIDDDIYYPTDIIEKTLAAHHKYPDAVISNYGYIIRYNQRNELLPYLKWKRWFSFSTDPNLFLGSGGGTLFKSSGLYKDLTQIELALRLTPIADDIWLNAMVKLVQRPIVLLPNGQLLPITIAGNTCLNTENINQNRNDIQLTELVKYYVDTLGFSPFQKRCVIP